MYSTCLLTKIKLTEPVYYLFLQVISSTPVPLPTTARSTSVVARPARRAGSKSAFGWACSRRGSGSTGSGAEGRSTGGSLTIHMRRRRRLPRPRPLQCSSNSSRQPRSSTWKVISCSCCCCSSSGSYCCCCSTVGLCSDYCCCS